MKERYLDIMARVVDVYTEEQFDAYVEKTRAEGVKEHGFPRLCANIGILMAHGRKLELKSRFEEMMEICCADMPVCGNGLGTRGNDFSVREILSCILELETVGFYPAETITRWKAAMSRIDPKTCYRMVAPEPPVAVDNWAAFNAASEQLRCLAGLAETQSYVENQIASQMFSFDENSMYRDPNEPMVYDVVTRNMLSTCLFYGYNGVQKDALEAHLRKAGELSLLMQSVSGELPYGGRSNQFIHNEAHLAVCFEYEAMRRKQLGDEASASRFKAAAKLALDTVEHWLDIAPGQHIKNYFPIASKFGCEKYAYYDKYMVTVASFLYLAYSFCDETIQPSSCPAIENGTYTWATSDAFRKLFCKSGPYFMEAELFSDPHYDSNGIGRIHRRGAPSAICLSVPASLTPNYTIDSLNPLPLSISCCGFFGDQWLYGADGSIILNQHFSADNEAHAHLTCTLPDQTQLAERICITPDGVNIHLSGSGKIGLMIPALQQDGQTNSQITVSEHSVIVRYKGWQCRYGTNGAIQDLQCSCSNRNGIYKMYRAEADDALTLSICIEPI